MPGGEEDRRKRPLSVTLASLLALGVAVYSTVYSEAIWTTAKPIGEPTASSTSRSAWARS